MRPSSLPPGPGHGAVNEEGRQRRRHPRAEDPRPVLLGQHACPARVDQQHRVPGGQEARRRRGLGVRQGRARQVEQLLAVLPAHDPQPHPAEGPGHLARGQPRPVGDVGPRRGPEGGQVAAHDVPHGLVPAHRRAPARPTPRPARRGRRAGAPRSPRAARARSPASGRSPRRRPRRAAPRPRAARWGRPRTSGAGGRPRPPSRPPRGRPAGRAATAGAAPPGWRWRTASSRRARRGGWWPASAWPGRRRGARWRRSGRAARAPRGATRAPRTSTGRTAPGGRPPAPGSPGWPRGPAPGAAGGPARPG